jgi:hypothetical protein
VFYPLGHGKYWKIPQHFFKDAFNMAHKLNFSGILVSSLLLTFEILQLKTAYFWLSWESEF